MWNKIIVGTIVSLGFFGVCFGQDLYDSFDQASLKVMDVSDTSKIQLIAKEKPFKKDASIIADCKDEKKDYPSAAGKQCHIFCKIENIRIVGPRCEGRESEGYVFVAGADSEISTRNVNNSCFLVKDFQSKSHLAQQACQKFQSDYPTGDTVKDWCEPRTKDNGEVFEYCFIYKAEQPSDDPFSVGKGEECFTNLDSVSIGGNSESEQKAIAGCMRLQDKYDHSGQSIPLCKLKPSTGNNVTKHEACFDATGLVTLTRSEREKLTAERAAQRLADEQARLAVERQRQQDLSREISFGSTTGSGLVPTCGTNGKGKICGWVELVQLGNSVINIVIWFATIILILMILKAGWLLIVSGGDASAKTKARDALLKAIVGFCVVLLAWLIVNAVITSLVRPDFLEDNKEVVDLLSDK